MLARNRIEALFHQDSDVSYHFYHIYRRESPLEPEKKLMLAVLEDAIVCFQQKKRGPTKNNKSDSKKAEEWIFEKNNHWLFSFESICETLGLNPMSIRERLLRERKKRRYLCG